MLSGTCQHTQGGSLPDRLQSGGLVHFRAGAQGVPSTRHDLLLRAARIRGSGLARAFYTRLQHLFSCWRGFRICPSAAARIAHFLTDCEAWRVAKSRDRGTRRAA